MYVIDLIRVERAQEDNSNLEDLESNQAGTNTRSEAPLHQNFDEPFQQIKKMKEYLVLKEKEIDDNGNQTNSHRQECFHQVWVHQSFILK